MEECPNWRNSSSVQFLEFYRRAEKEGAMQQNGQEPPERKSLPQAVEQPGPEDESASPPASTEGEQQLSMERQKAEEYLDLLRRTQADFVNYRRRVGQEQAETRIAAQSELLSRLLPILDDFGRALGATPPELAKHPWAQGLFLIARRLTTVLDQLGVRQLGTPGELFDPRWHEAITTESREDVPEGTILQVIQPGYALGERVIRPAQVVVASAPSPLRRVPAGQEDSKDEQADFEEKEDSEDE
jgi:molecular chaperone GrpE